MQGIKITTCLFLIGFGFQMIAKELFVSSNSNGSKKSPRGSAVARPMQAPYVSK